MIYRHSIVVEFFPARRVKLTPEPFVELRVTMYSKFPLPRLLIRKRLIEEISHLAWTFYSIRIAIAEMSATCEFKPKSEYTILLPHSKKLMILSGFEYNVKVSDEEAIEHIAMNVYPIWTFLSNPTLYIESVKVALKKFLKRPIYNAIFYETDGTVKREFNDWEIRNYVAPQGAGFTRASRFRGDYELSEFDTWKELFKKACRF